MSNRTSEGLPGGLPGIPPASYSYWQLRHGPSATADQGVDPPPGADVVIVGGGVMGSSVAYWLAREGADVLLLEARHLGSGASGRNAGLMLASGSPLEDPGLFQSVCEEEGIDADFAMPGHLALAMSTQAWSAFQAEADLPTSRVRAIDRRACEELLGLEISPHVLGGRWFSSGALVDPVKLCYGLARAASRLGARLIEQVAAISIRPARTGPGWTVVTSRGATHARYVVCAGGIWTSSLLPELHGALQPVRAQVMSTVPCRQTFRIGLAIDWGTAYWRQTHDGSVVVGGLRQVDAEPESVAVESVNPKIQRALDDLIPATFPGLAIGRTKHRWAGVMDVTVDGRPFVGRVQGVPGRYVVAGFGGHGLPAALGVGKALAGALRSETLPEILQNVDPGRILHSAYSA